MKHIIKGVIIKGVIIKGVRAVLKFVIPVVYSQRYLAGVLENHRYPIKISRV